MDRKRKKEEWQLGPLMLPLLVVGLSSHMACQQSRASPFSKKLTGAWDPPQIPLVSCSFHPDPNTPFLPPPPPKTPDWVVITADHLESVAKKWAAYRQHFGHHTAVWKVSEILAGRILDPEGFVQEVHSRLRPLVKALSSQSTLHLLLLGDSDPKEDADGVDPRLVPALSYSDLFYSDAFYADLNGDGLPELSVGRVPVRTVRQAETVLNKVILYESNHEPDGWKRHLMVFASEGGFGPLLDTLLEQLAFKLIMEVSDDWTLSVAHARKSSAYALPPRSYSERIYDQMNQGALIAFYVGHGYLDSLEEADWGNGDKGPILDTANLDRFRCGTRCPIMVLVACHTGDFARGESLAERILSQPLAPPAVLAATEVSHPFPNALLTRQLARQVLVLKRQTLGEAYTRALTGMMKADDEVHHNIQALARVFLPQNERRELMESHQRMYVLMGDPALRLPLSHDSVTLKPKSKRVRPGDTIGLCGQIHGPTQGGLLLTMETQRSALAHPLRPVGSSPDRDSIIESNWIRANDRVLLQRTGRYKRGGFGFRFTIPRWIKPGTYVLRVVASDGLRDATGTTSIRVDPLRIFRWPLHRGDLQRLTTAESSN